MSQTPPLSSAPPLRRDKTLAIYNQIASLYHLFKTKEGIETLLENLHLQPGQRILEVGTGPGLYALHVAKEWPTSQMVGLDPTQRFIEIAQKEAQKEGLSNVQFDLGEAERMPYDDETFDRIFYSGALVVIPGKADALRETYRVLKPGGIAVFKELPQTFMLQKELFYLLWTLYVKIVGLLNKEVRAVKRSDFEGQKFSEEQLAALFEESPFEHYRIFVYNTRLYAVCHK